MTGQKKDNFDEAEKTYEYASFPNNVKPYEYNRVTRQSKVDDIVRCLKRYAEHLEGGCIDSYDRMFKGTFGKNKVNGKTGHIIDGNHRYYGVKKYEEKTGKMPPFPIVVEYSENMYREGEEENAAVMVLNSTLNIWQAMNLLKTGNDTYEPIDADPTLFKKSTCSHTTKEMLLLQEKVDEVRKIYRLLYGGEKSTTDYQWFVLGYCAFRDRGCNSATMEKVGFDNFLSHCRKEDLVKCYDKQELWTEKFQEILDETEAESNVS